MAYLLRFRETCLPDEAGSNAATQTSTFVHAEQDDRDPNRKDEEVIPKPSARSRIAPQMATQTVTRVAAEQNDTDRQYGSIWAGQGSNNTIKTGKPRPTRTLTEVAKENGDPVRPASQLQLIPFCEQKPDKDSRIRLATQTSTKVAGETDDSDRPSQSTRVIPSAADPNKCR